MWPPNELDKIGAAEELQLATRRTDGSLRPFVTMWVAHAEGKLFVRSARGPENPWYRRALASGQGRIRAGGVECDVTLTPVEESSSLHAALDADYHRKYDRYGAAIVNTVVGSNARLVTIRLDPID